MHGWVITKDHIDAGTYKATPKPSDWVKFIKENGTPFRLYDDDGELYYEGHFVMTDDHTGFEPLDWAMGNAGCTEIRYRERGKWVTL
jgi:hypothetical protein